MTGDEFRAFLNANGLTQAEFARRLGVSARGVRHWCSGDRPVPPWLSKMLEGEKQPHRSPQEAPEGVLAGGPV